jgi:integration host factor subunit beta
MLKPERAARIVSQNPRLYNRDGERLISAILHEITSALARGDRVELRGFGTFSVRHRPARDGRNPKNGRSVSVPERSHPFFKMSKELHLRLNSKVAEHE